MDYFQLEYGLFAEAPDLIQNVPGLGKLKEKCPEYIKKAEGIQKLARRFAREEILPRSLDIDLKCSRWQITVFVERLRLRSPYR